MMIHFFRWYVEAGALLAVGYGLVSAVQTLRPDEPVRWLKLGYAVFLLALVLPVMTARLPREFLPHASVQIWSGHPRGVAAPYTLLASSAQPQAKLQGWAVGDRWLGVLVLAGMCALFLSLLMHVRGVLRLVRVLRASTPIRRIGRVSVLISDTETVPFSAWLPGRAYAVLPIELLARRGDFGIALGHELQHHRQRDTLWVHFFEFFKALFFWNPAAHGWCRMIERLQELACDEVLIGHKHFSPQAYGSCLIRAAQQTASGSSVLLAGTTGMATGRSGRFLRRRIEMLFVTDRKRSSRWAVLSFFVLSLSLMGGTAFAARGLVQSHKFTQDEVRKLVAFNHGSGGSEIPITVNERVLHQLDKYIGTAEGREYVKGCLSRMPLYHAMIEGKIAAQGFPPELMAMPLNESCFRNDVISPAPYKSRGIWQFIEPTAITYGLQVDDHVDERLDPEKETDAAMRLLKDLKAQFADWRLAIKAYNEGEKHVQGLIDQYHTRDPWELEDHGTAENYLANTMAMMIILKNQSLLD